MSLHPQIKRQTPPLMPTTSPQHHMNDRHCRNLVLSAIATIAIWPSLLLMHPASAQDGNTNAVTLPENSPRVTPLVKVIRKIAPAVVSLFTPIAENQIMSGSGTIIHPSGIVLTNNHVLPNAEGFAIRGNEKPTKFEVLARYPESDIALVRLPEKTTWDFLPLGHSADTLVGESIVVAGNPGGRGMAFTSGIISAVDVLEGGPNAMIMSNYTNDRRGRLIQFDAASNKGNSGGPLVNMDGEVIGVVSAVIQGEQNIGLAIPIDRVRELFDRMLEPELIYNKSTGIEIDPLAKTAQVRSINPAFPSTIQPGDSILEVNGRPLRDAVDWYLSLEQILPLHDELKIRFQNAKGVEEITWKTTPTIAQASAPAQPTAAGWNYDYYEGKFNQIPDFTALVPTRMATTDTLDIPKLTPDRQDNFALRFTGFIDIPNDGVYRIVLISDDGSKLYLNDQIFIDHDGNHPPTPASRLVRLQAGLLPVKLEYFQGNGSKSLHLVVEPCLDRKDVSLKDMKLAQGERLRRP